MVGDTEGDRGCLMGRTGHRVVWVHPDELWKVLLGSVLCLNH